MKTSTLLNEEAVHDSSRPASVLPRRYSLRLKREASSDEYTPDDNSHKAASNESAYPGRIRARVSSITQRSKPGAFVGEMRYPPHTVTDESLQTQMKKYHIRSQADILGDPSSIPYSSDKKGFHLQTGRKGFQAFRYSFKLSDGGKEWDVMWDYNIGLVRITPFFKALGYAKTIPAKAIAMTPGLSGMCHSITGGSLKAQGYWIPFEAAKALLGTFCWELRVTLMPVFGPEFLETCYAPEDPAFKRFTIDHSVVVKCQEEARGWKVNAVGRRSISVKPRGKAASASDSNMGNDADTDTEADTDPTPRPKRFLVPSRWTAIDLPASPALSEAHRSSSAASSSMLMSTVSDDESSATKRTFSDVESNADAGSAETSHRGEVANKHRRIAKFGVEEARAAYALIQLSGGENQC